MPKSAIGKKLLIVLALVLLFFTAGAAFQSTFGGGGTNLTPTLTDSGTTLTYTGTNVSLPNGTAANPSLTWANSATAGFYSPGATAVGFTSGGAAKSVMAATGMNFINTNSIGWVSSTDPTVAPDTILGRGSPGGINWGGAAGASPVAYTLSGQSSRAGTDTNTAGANTTYRSGSGTGNATPTSLIFTNPALGTASGTGAQTQVKHKTINTTKALTSGAATTIASIPLATLQNTGGHVIYHLEASDGTNQCSTDGTISYSAENSAGVFVTNISSIANAATACTATKTLTVAWTMTSANPALLQATPTLTGITATSFNIVYEASNFGQTDVTW